jgi:DNA-binding transcriptional MerR regulator
MMEISHKEPGQEPLPAIPAKRYFTIGEVSELCGVKPHVLRYWEQEFSQLRPVKRRGNRRYYQHHEVLLVAASANCSTARVSPSAAPATVSTMPRTRRRQVVRPEARAARRTVEHRRNAAAMSHSGFFGYNCARGPELSGRGAAW